jgi:SAM-dependent methyltransferase
MRRYAPGDIRSICEFGGANSCFYAPVRQAYAEAGYSVIDNNALGLELLRDRCAGDRLLDTRLENVLAMADGVVRADIVYSVGLIEHFPPDESATVIRKHFSCVRPGGLVIITFPTPTWLYRATRSLAELVGAWQFPDERPLSFDEVEAQIRKYGDILESRINWPIILTQGVVVARAW